MSKKSSRKRIDSPSPTESWTDFLRDIARARAKIDCPEGGKYEAWFRGHSKSDFALLPSLFRAFKKPNEEPQWTKVFHKESDLFWEFAARAKELHGITEDDWDILFTMQHYGTPTRLLDWTEAFAVAVYFAVLGVDETYQEGEPPCIWILNPYLLNEASGWAEDGPPDIVHPPNLGWDKPEGCYYTYGDLLSLGYMDWKWPTSIYPRQRNARIHAQRAWFTIHGDKFLPMEKIPGHEKYLRKVKLPFTAVADAKRFLELAGINHYLLYSDLESLSLHLQEKNGIISRAQAESKAKSRIDRRDVVPPA